MIKMKRWMIAFITLLLCFLSGCSEPLPLEPVSVQQVEKDYQITVSSAGRSYRRRDLKSAQLTLTVEYTGEGEREVSGSSDFFTYYLCDNAGVPLEDSCINDEQYFFTFSADHPYELSWDCGDRFKKIGPGTYQIKFWGGFRETADPQRSVEIDLTLPLEILK